jgi:hypothetical protein
MPTDAGRTCADEAAGAACDEELMRMLLLPRW